MATLIKKLPAGKVSQRSVVNQIIIQPTPRKASTVDAWRTALRSADMGRVKQLFDLFDDLLIDGTLSDAIGKRIDAVTNSELTFQGADGSAAEEITTLIDSPAWEDLLTTIMQSRFWGRSGIEFDFSSGFSVAPIPQKHIKLENSQILLNEYDDSGISYDQDDLILVLGRKRDFGLLLKTAPFAIYKRGGFGDYAQWLEIFGMPQRIGKYSSFDPESRRLLIEAMEKSGSAPWVVIPKETDVELIDKNNSGQSSPHNEFRKACNEEMLITVLGQTMTTVQGDKGARSLGEVHKEVEEGKNKSDMRMVQRVLNHNVLPILEKRGFPVKGGKFIFPKAAEPLTVEEVVKLSGIISIPRSYLHDKYSIPVPKDGEEVAGVTIQEPIKEPVKETDPPTGEPPKDPKKKKEKIKNSDRSFKKWLSDFFALAPAAMTGASHGDLLTLNDSDLTDRIIKFVDEGEGTFFPDLFDFISKDLIGALDQRSVTLTDLGFTYNYQNDAFRTAQEMNLFHFSAAKDLAEIQRLNELYRQSKSFQEFYNLAKLEIDVFNKTWQKTEWETATLIASSTELYNRLISKVKIFPYWEYKTVGDDKVRPEHQLLDGVILPASDPRWKKIWPPNGWKCRCYIVPRLASEVKDVNFDSMRERVDAFFETAEWASASAQGFGVNRAITPEVFSEDQMYIKKFPGQASRLLKDINYNTFGLKSMQRYRSMVTDPLSIYSGSAAEFFKKMANEDGKIFFKDYNDRSVLFDESAYLKGHSEVKYADRTSLLTGVQQTLQLPDEVWINDTGSKTFNQYVFIKYYTDKTFAAFAEIKDGIVYRLKTWFTIEEGKVSKYKYRRGLLIKKPGK